MIYTVLKEINLTLFYKSGSEEEMTLVPPNGSMGVVFSEVYTGSPIFRDRRRHWRKGTRFSRAKFILNYSSSYIEQNKLLASEKIEVNFNGIDPPFLNTLFRFENTGIKKHWMESVPLTQDGNTLEDANPIPDGASTLEFLSVDFIEKEEDY